MIGNLTRSLGIGYLLCLCASAQTLPTERPIPSDDVTRAIEEFNRTTKGGLEKSDGATVLLEPPASSTAARPANRPGPLVGKPAVAASSAEPELPAEELPARDLPEPGLEIHIESIRKDTGDIDPKDLKLETSFPVKLLSAIPENWILAASDNAPAFKRDIEIAPGTLISVKIPPHILSAEADGSNSFSVSEPGFAAPEGYKQKDTISAILGESITQLDEDSKKLDTALADLHTLLASLPKPAPEPVDPPEE